MTQPPTAEQYRMFQTLINANPLTPQQRGQAWAIFKTEGAEAGTAYVEHIRESLAPQAWTTLREKNLPYAIWGNEHIDSASRDQMDWAMRLPVAAAGALMPDAHKGYGLPIGGVLATEESVIPYAVGVDIACRMMMTIYTVSPTVLDQPETSEYRLLHQALVENTIFGAGGDGLHSGIIDHPVLDESRWTATPLIKNLRQTAIYQIGTSGTGNHFVEWGAVELPEANPFQLPAGRYLGLLSHSGSRGVGYKIADHYSKLAMSLMPALDKDVQHLAWLALQSEPGAEYWDAMHLAGEFASANHHVIHERVARGAGLTPAAALENHHNFAWKETHMIDGQPREVIVHRKGATPAGQGVLGIIPGTMADLGYIVQGKGEARSLHSASHGGGRAMSRTKAKQTITPEAQAAYLREHGVTLIGGGLDEAPQAYKPIETVIGAQLDLVNIVGTFQPRLVRMATDETPWKRKPMPDGIIDAESD